MKRPTTLSKVSVTLPRLQKLHTIVEPRYLELPALSNQINSSWTHSSFIYYWVFHLPSRHVQLSSFPLRVPDNGVSTLFANVQLCKPTGAISSIAHSDLFLRSFARSPSMLGSGVFALAFSCLCPCPTSLATTRPFIPRSPVSVNWGKTATKPWKQTSSRNQECIPAAM